MINIIEIKKHNVLTHFWQWIIFADRKEICLLSAKPGWSLK